MHLIKIVIPFCLIVTTVSACSKENWISVGDDFYVDSASAKRNGDIGTVRIKYGTDTGSYEFDCKSRKMLKIPDMQVDADSPMGKASALACTKWFEVWKK